MKKKDTKKKKKYGLGSLIVVCLSSAPLATSVKGLLGLITGIVPTVKIVTIAAFIDSSISFARGETEVERLIVSLAVLVTTLAMERLLPYVSGLADTRLKMGLRKNHHPYLLDKTAALPYRYIENSDTWDTIQRVTSGSEDGRMAEGYTTLLNLLALVFRLGGLFTLLFFQSPLPALLITGASIPLFILALKAGKASYDADREAGYYDRREKYLAELLTGRETAGERALFHYGEELTEMWHKQYETARRIRFKVIRKWHARMIGGGFLASFAGILAAGVLLVPLAKKTISPGNYVSLVTALFDLSLLLGWQLNHMLDSFSNTWEYLKDLTRFSSLPEISEPRKKLSAKETPSPFLSLEVKDLHFTYQDTDKEILSGLSLKMEPSKSYALVGINGAGKTTFTRILTGLYREYQGEIILNGKDLRCYTQEELNTFFALVYQDFARYQISLKDNLFFGEEGRCDTIVKRVGLDKIAAQLPQGVDTALGKLEEGAVDLSGGEWQKIAMARALAKGGHLRILDEPTAALDPINEARLYRQYKEISGGNTTLFITHRLGAATLADTIFVLDGGKVVEEGSHRELMEKRESYYSMFEAQRSWYKEENL